MGSRVPSSVIYGMRYHPGARVLDVVFRGSGEVYRYLDVPPTIWRQFVRAPSKGTYLNTVFKDQGYTYERFAPYAQGPRLASVAASAATTHTAEALGESAPPPEPSDRPDPNVWGFYD